MRGGVHPTDAIQTACVEISESKFDRVLFSVIDTPGLDFHEGRELVLERQLGRVMRYLDQQYADTMSEVRVLSFFRFWMEGCYSIRSVSVSRLLP